MTPEVAAYCVSSLVGQLSLIKVDTELVGVVAGVDTAAAAGGARALVVACRPRLSSVLMTPVMVGRTLGVPNVVRRPGRAA